MKFLNNVLEFFKAKTTKNLLDDKTYEERVEFLIKCIEEFQSKEIDNLKLEAHSSFYYDKISVIKDLVKNQDFKKIEEQFPSKDATFEDLAYFSFTDASQKKYVAIIYDSYELWQDPEVFDIIAIDE